MFKNKIDNETKILAIAVPTVAAFACFIVPIIGHVGLTVADFIKWVLI